MDVDSSIDKARPVEVYLFSLSTMTYAYTNFYRDKQYGGVVYKAAPISHGELAPTIETGKEFDITVPRDNAVAALFYTVPPQEPIYVRIVRLQETNSSQADALLIGRVRSCEFEDAEATLKVIYGKGISDKKFPRITQQPYCMRVHYDQYCGINREQFKVEATLTKAEGRYLYAETFREYPTNHFAYGLAEWQGQLRTVIASSGDKIALRFPFVGYPTGQMTVYPGCSKTPEACAQWNNSDNFLGWPWIPEKNPVDGVT